MNEKVDVANVIEVSNTKHTKKRGGDSDDDDDGEDGSGTPGKTTGPANEEEKKYHENVISDVYGSISSDDDDDDDDDEEEDEDLQNDSQRTNASNDTDRSQHATAGAGSSTERALRRELRAKEAELKRQQQPAIGRVGTLVAEAAAAQTEKAKVLFANAFSKVATSFHQL
jgi:hypothetical protein